MLIFMLMLIPSLIGLAFNILIILLVVYLIKRFIFSNSNPETKQKSKTLSFGRNLCPYTGEKADRTIKLIYVTGMLFLMRYSEELKYVSRKGQIKACLLALLYNLIFGWWGVRSFILNVYAIFNNVSALFVSVEDFD